MSINQLNIAKRFMIHGKLDAALEKYYQILKDHPSYFLCHAFLGNLLIRLNRIDEAISEYQRGIELSPRLASFHYSIGLAYVKNGAPDQAIQSFKQAIEIKPYFYQFHNSLGEVLLHQSRVEEAILSCQRAIELNFSSYRAHFNLGECLSDQQKWEDSLVEYRTSIDLHPSFYRSHFRLGEVFLKLGQTEEAVSCYRRAIALELNFFWPYLKLGDILASRGETEEAITMYRRANQIDPQASTWSHYNLGLVLDKQGQADEAISCYRQALEIDSNFFWPHLKLADILSKQGQNQEAITMYRRANQIDPQASAWSHYNLGLVLDKQGQADEAISCYRQAIEIDPKFFLPHLKLADALLMQRQHQEAITIYYRAIELNPDETPWIYYNLGDALDATGQTEESINCYRQAINIDPTLFQPYLRLADSLAKLGGEEEEAIAMYHKAIQFSDNHNPLPYHHLADVLVKLGKLNESIDYYYRATLSDSKYFEADLRLGEILEKLDRQDEANAIYRQGILKSNQTDNSKLHEDIIDYLKESDSFNQSSISKNCIFITARFRTGSSYLYSLFDCLENVDVFYEPLNEDLVRWLKRDEEFSFKNKQIYNHSFEGKYFSEYQVLNQNQEIEKLHSITFSGIKPIMSSKDSFNQMKSYLQFILDYPSENYKMLQFNRIDFRLGWIKSEFPNALIVNLRRNPRDIYSSYIETFKKIYKVNPVGDNQLGELFLHDLNFHINFFNRKFKDSLHNSLVNDYEKLYLINRLSNLWADHFADVIIEYESLVKSPVETLSKITSLIPNFNLSFRKEIIPAKKNRVNVWKDYHPESWFVESETKCDEILARIKLPQ